MERDGLGAYSASWRALCQGCSGLLRITKLTRPVEEKLAEYVGGENRTLSATVARLHWLDFFRVRTESVAGIGRV